MRLTIIERQGTDLICGVENNKLLEVEKVSMSLV